MGAESPAEGGDVKPDTTTNNSNTNNQGGRNRRKKNKKQQQVRLGKSDFVGQNKSIGTITGGGSNFDKLTQFNEFINTISTFAATSFGSKAANSVINRKLVEVQAPDSSDYDADKKIDEIKYKMDYTNYTKEKNALDEHLQRLYHIALGQIDDSTKATLKESDKFEKMNEEMDLITLLKLLEGICFNSDSTTEPFFALVQALLSLITLRQNDRTLDVYHKKFTETLHACNEAFGGNNVFMDAMSGRYVTIICKENGVNESALDNTTKEAYVKQGRERMEAMLFLLNADRSRYGTTVDVLRQDYIKFGTTSYPKNLNTAYALLRSVKTKRAPHVPVDTGHTFNTNGEQDGDTLVNDGGTPPCPRCARTNHVLSECRAVWHNDGTRLPPRKQDENGGTVLHMEEVLPTGEIEDEEVIEDESVEHVF
mmetsp:Transcript_12276/g.17626  ORF Transcript_12276/g.17626 Transcript_12276/m.17626 type:complete len:424 (-) Transcript_12276:529-1800(-)